MFHSDSEVSVHLRWDFGRLKTEEIKISWSGRRTRYDNILVERLWRTVKYEEGCTCATTAWLGAEISWSDSCEVLPCKDPIAFIG